MTRAFDQESATSCVTMGKFNLSGTWFLIYRLGKLIYIFPKTVAKIKGSNWYERAMWAVKCLHMWETSDFFFFFTVITITFPSFVSCPYSCSVGSLTCVSGGEGLRFPLTPRKLERRCHLLYVLLGTSFLTRQVGDKDSKHSRQSKGSSDKKSEITRHSAWHKGDS